MLGTLSQCLCINPGCATFKRPREYAGEPCQSCHANLLLNHRYLVTKMIHENGNLNSRVFEAIDTKSNNQPVIVKVIYLDEYVDESSKERARDRFKREVTALSELNERNIPGIPKIEKESDFLLEFPSQNRNSQALAFAMEKVEGQDLSKWMKSPDYRIPDEEQITNWLRQLVNTLEKLHQRNYYHRDVKPSNIILKPDGNLVLIDLGAVCDVTHNALEGKEGQQLTRLGTAFYAAPEQLQDGIVNNTTDFYALGRTFIHLMTGKDPSSNWRSNLPNRISYRLANLLDMLTKQKPEERYQNVEQIKRELEQIKRELIKKRITQERDKKVQEIINNIRQNLLNPRNIIPLFMIGILLLVVYVLWRASSQFPNPVSTPTSTPVNDGCKTNNSFSPLAEAAKEAYINAYTKADSGSIIKQFKPNQILFEQAQCKIKVTVKPSNAKYADVQNLKTKLPAILNNPYNYDPEFRDKFKVYFKVEGDAEWKPLEPS
jgi:serine/threonine protein kinase